jgi:hypothetical protein
MVHLTQGFLMVVKKTMLKGGEGEAVHLKSQSLSEVSVEQRPEQPTHSYSEGFSLGTKHYGELLVLKIVECGYGITFFKHEVIITS